MRSSLLLFLAILLSGCGAQPAPTASDCCHAPPPGTLSVHVGGNVTTAVGVTGR